MNLEYLEGWQAAQVMVVILQVEEVKANELYQIVLEIPKYQAVLQVEQSLEQQQMVLMAEKVVRQVEQLLGLLPCLKVDLLALWLVQKK